VGILRGVAAGVGLWLIIAGGTAAALEPRAVLHWAPALLLGLAVFLGVLRVLGRG